MLGRLILKLVLKNKRLGANAIQRSILEELVVDLLDAEVVCTNPERGGMIEKEKVANIYHTRFRQGGRALDKFEFEVKYLWVVTILVIRKCAAGGKEFNTGDSAVLQRSFLEYGELVCLICNSRIWICGR